MRASDKETHGNEKPSCINIITQLWAFLGRVALMPCSSPGQLGGKRRRADTSTARPVPPVQRTAWMQAFSSPGLQSSPKAHPALWKRNEQSLHLCLKRSLAIPKGAWRDLWLVVGHAAKAIIVGSLPAAVFCAKLKQTGFFLLLWESCKRGMKRWKKPGRKKDKSEKERDWEGEGRREGK